MTESLVLKSKISILLPADTLKEAIYDYVD